MRLADLLVNQTPGIRFQRRRLVGPTKTDDLTFLVERSSPSRTARRSIIKTTAVIAAKSPDKAREVIAQAEVKIIRLTKKVGAPFPQMGDMVEKMRELLQLEDELRADGKQ